MKLYNYWRSSSSWRVRIALHWKRIPFEYVPIHLLKEGGQQNTEGYRRLNPVRTVPLLELEEGGQVHRLSQSVAIIELLEERHPEPPLLPKDRLLRAHARQLAEQVNSGIQPLQNLTVLQYVKKELHQDDKPWLKHWISRGLEGLEAAAAPGAGRFLVRDEVTVADLYLVPQLYSARRFGVDLAPYPTLVRVERELAELPAFKAAHPDACPDAES